MFICDRVFYTIQRRKMAINTYCLQSPFSRLHKLSVTRFTQTANLKLFIQLL